MVGTIWCTLANSVSYQFPQQEIYSDIVARLNYFYYNFITNLLTDETLLIL